MIARETCSALEGSSLVQVFLSPQPLSARGEARAVALRFDHPFTTSLTFSFVVSFVLWLLCVEWMWRRILKPNRGKRSGFFVPLTPLLLFLNPAKNSTERLTAVVGKPLLFAARLVLFVLSCCCFSLLGMEVENIPNLEYQYSS